MEVMEERIPFNRPFIMSFFLSVLIPDQRVNHGFLESVAVNRFGF